jgi:hypothetical protein
MMSNSYTLHQLVAAPMYWEALLQRIQNVWQHGDQLLLLAEAAQGYADPRLLQFGKPALLTLDMACLPDEPFAEHIQLLSTEQWSSLILQYQRHITWR